MLIHCYFLLLLFVGVCVWVLFCYAVPRVLSGFAVVMYKKVLSEGVQF